MKILDSGKIRINIRSNISENKWYSFLTICIEEHIITIDFFYKSENGLGVKTINLLNLLYIVFFFSIYGWIAIGIILFIA